VEKIIDTFGPDDAILIVEYRKVDGGVTPINLNLGPNFILEQLIVAMEALGWGQSRHHSSSSHL